MNLVAIALASGTVWGIIGWMAGKFDERRAWNKRLEEAGATPKRKKNV